MSRRDDARARLDRFMRLRESGWSGPIDQEGRAVMSRTDDRGRPLRLFGGGSGTRTPDDPQMRDARNPLRQRAQRGSR